MAKKMGRKVIEIDWNEFDKLCSFQCTLAEIASWFDVSEDTIERRVKEYSGETFADYYKQKRGAGFVSLRRKQFEVAMSGDKTMLIWLGKQYLGQRENDIYTNQDIKEIEIKISKHEKQTND